MWPDEDAAVIEPRKGKREETLPRAALFVFTPQDVDLFLKGFQQPPHHHQRYYLVDVYRGNQGGAPVALAGPMIGAPQTVLLLEKLAALGVADVLAIGWCGSLQSDVCIGDVVLPVSALSEEGTSAHYPLGGLQPGPSLGLLAPFRKLLVDAGLRVHEGCVWSTDAPFRETRSKVLRYQAQGVLAVDMETSALFAVSHFRSIRLAVAMVVSDELATLKWRHGFREAVFKETRMKMAEVALEFAGSLGLSEL